MLAITGYFVITSGRNARQVRAIADEIEEQLTILDGPKPSRVEGRAEAEWLLMDYGDFVVHVFQSSSREYYDLERLWSDQPRLTWSEEPFAGSAKVAPKRDRFKRPGL